MVVVGIENGVRYVRLYQYMYDSSSLIFFIHK